MVGSLGAAALHLLADVDSGSVSYTVGYYAGAALPLILVTAGVVKCVAIARRPTTSSLAALSLALLLGSFLLSMAGGLAVQWLKEGPGQTDRGALVVGAVSLTLLLAIGLMILASIVLAVLAMAAIHVEPQLYRQGRRQAVATLVLAPLLLVLFVLVGAISADNARQQRPPRFAVDVPAAPPLALSTPVAPALPSPVEPPVEPSTQPVVSVPAPVSDAPASEAPAAPAQPVRQDIYDMPEHGFEYEIPPIPWVVTDSKKITPDSCLGFIHARPSIFFLIIAEDMGEEEAFDTEGLAEIAVANLKSVSGAADVVERVPHTVSGVPGIRVYTRARLPQLNAFYVHWVTVRDGYAFQLITAGDVKDEARIRQAAEAMQARWKPKAARTPVALEPFHSPYGYRVELAAPGWRAWKTIGRDAPDAEHGALLGAQTCMNVMPILTSGLDASDHRALSAGLLSRYGLSLDQISNLRDVAPQQEGAGVSGSTFDCTALVGGTTTYYRFKLLRNRDVALMAAAWTQDAAQRERLPEALAAVRLDPAATGPDRKQFQPADNRRHALVFNIVGLYHQEQQKFDAATRFLEAASALDGDPIILGNLISAYVGNKQLAEAQACAVRGMTQHPQHDQFKADAAFCLGQLGQTDRALEVYARLFRGGYREDSYFLDFQSLLEKAGKVDDAVAAGEAYLARAPSDAFRVVLAQADLLARHGKNDRAVAMLEERHRRDPANPGVATVLASHYVEASRYNEALATLKPLREAPDPSIEVLLVHGQAQAGLKQFADAKATFEAALSKNPSSKAARDWLAAVSGQLGEGSNSAVKAPIEAVAIPPELLQPPATAKVPPDCSIYYVSKVTAFSFVPEKDCRQTEYRRVKIVDQRGVESYATAQFPFDSLGERMFVNKLEVRDETGKVLAVGKVEDSYVMDDQSDEMATYRKVLHVPIPALRPGCEVEMVVTKEDLSRPKELPFYQHLMHGYFPAQRSALFVRGELASVKRAGSADVAARETDGGVAWVTDDLPEIRYEPLQPAAVTYLPWVALGGAGAGTTWESEGRAYLALIAERLKPDPAAAALAQRLTAGLATEADKVAALLRHVQQDYTYRAIEFGRRARVPLPVADVIHNHYGDCKDHALLLHQLLGAIGVESRLALVNAYGPLRVDMPSLDQFNHILVAVPPPPNAAAASGTSAGWRFYDCTDKDSDLRAGHVHSLVTDRVLLLDPAAPRLLELPTPTDAVGHITVTRDVKLGEQGEVAVDETVTWSGYDAGGMRAMLRAIEPARRTETLKAMLSGGRGGRGGDVTLTRSSITGLEDRTQPVTIKASYTGGRKFSALTQQLVGALPAPWERYHLEADAVDGRRTPFQVRLPRSLKASVTVHLPSGYRVGELPKDQSIDDPFRQARATWTAGDGTLSLDFTLARKAGSHAPGEYDAYVQSANRLIELLETHLVVQKAAAP